MRVNKVFQSMYVCTYSSILSNLSPLDLNFFFFKNFSFSLILKRAGLFNNIENQNKGVLIYDW